MITTTADLARWIRRLIRGEAGLDRTIVTQMCTSTAANNNYGLGIVHYSYAGVDLGYGHSGATGGYIVDAGLALTHMPELR
jgi:hypothetical protein